MCQSDQTIFPESQDNLQTQNLNPSLSNRKTYAVSSVSHKLCKVLYPTEYKASPVVGCSNIVHSTRKEMHHQLHHDTLFVRQTLISEMKKYAS